MASTTRDAPLTSRVIRDESEWDALRPAWDAVHASARTAAPCLDFGWLRHWWRVFGAIYGPGGLRIVTVWRTGELIAALPLYVGLDDGARVLRFVSTGEAEHEETCPEYLDLLCRPDDQAAGAVAAWREVDRLEWDGLEWLDMPSESPLLVAARVDPRARSLDRGTCPVADLSGGFDAYLGRLSANGRQQARRLLREGEQAGARLEFADTDQADRAFDDLRRLHDARWQAAGQAGAFTSGRFVEFHQALIREWLAGGRAVLARLWLSDELMGVLYGFVAGHKFDFYQSGLRRDDAGRLRSPGTLAHLLVMKALAERGVTTYDFLRGDASYKARLSTREHSLAGVRIWRLSPRTAAVRTRRLVGRLARSVGRLRHGAGS